MEEDSEEIRSRLMEKLRKKFKEKNLGKNDKEIIGKDEDELGEDDSKKHKKKLPNSVQRAKRNRSKPNRGKTRS